MEKQVLALLIPIFALAIPLAGIVFVGLQKLARTRIEEARLEGRWLLHAVQPAHAAGGPEGAGSARARSRARA